MSVLIVYLPALNSSWSLVVVWLELNFMKRLPPPTCYLPTIWNEIQIVNGHKMQWDSKCDNGMKNNLQWKHIVLKKIVMKHNLWWTANGNKTTCQKYEHKFCWYSNYDETHTWWWSKNFFFIKTDFIESVNFSFR